MNLAMDENLEELQSIFHKCYEWNGKVITCYVDVKPRRMQYTINSPVIRTFNWLQSEDWVAFEKVLYVTCETELKETRKFFVKTEWLRDKVEVHFNHTREMYERIYNNLGRYDRLIDRRVDIFFQCTISYIEDEPLAENNNQNPQRDGNDESAEGSSENDSKDNAAKANKDKKVSLDSNASSSSSEQKQSDAEIIEASPENAKKIKKSPFAATKARKRRDEVASLIDDLTVYPDSNKKRTVRRPSFVEYSVIYGTKKMNRKRAASSKEKPLNRSGNKKEPNDSNNSNENWKDIEVPKNIKKKKIIPEAKQEKNSNDEGKKTVKPRKKEKIKSKETESPIKDIKTTLLKSEAKLNSSNFVQLHKLIRSINPHPPRSVQFLDLRDMSEEEIFATFDDYKEELDKVFHSQKHNDRINGYKGNDHFLVMSLTEEAVQHKIMNKLSDIYEADLGKSAAFARLFANALMPEWLLNIFMSRYSFTRAQAIQHLKDEDKYRTYIESHSDEAFVFFSEY